MEKPWILMSNSLIPGGSKERMGRSPRNGHRTLRDYTGIGGTAKGCQIAIGTSSKNLVERLEGNNSSGSKGNTVLLIDGVHEIHTPRPQQMAVGRLRTLAGEMGEFNHSSGAIQSHAPFLAIRYEYSLDQGARPYSLFQNHGTPCSIKQAP